MEAVGAVKSQEIRGPEAVLSLNSLNLDKKGPGVPEKKQGNFAKVEMAAEAKVERIAKAMDNYVKSIQRDLMIRVHKETGNTMVKVISRENGEVIREIPPEKLLNLAAKMEEMAGVLFNESA